MSSSEGEKGRRLFSPAIRFRMGVLTGYVGAALPYAYDLLITASNLQGTETTFTDFGLAYANGALGSATVSGERVIYDTSIKSRIKRTARDITTIALGSLLTTAAKGLSPREAAFGAISTTSGIIFTRKINQHVRNEP